MAKREFSRFSIDLALPLVDVDAERVDASPALTGVAQVDELPPLWALSFVAQIADKICAMFERHGEQATFSSRARDLADIAMIVAQVDLDGASLQQSLRAEEARRLEAGTLHERLPAGLRLPDDQRADWSMRWRQATRDAPVSFADALTAAATFLDPLLAGRASGLRWHAATQAWS